MSDSDFESDSDHFVVMSETEKHEAWLEYAHDTFQWELQYIREGRRGFPVFFPLRTLMLLTMELHLWESLEQTLNNVSPGSSHLGINVSWIRFTNDHDCRNSPDDEALEAAAIKLARVVSSCDSFRRLYLETTPPLLHHYSWRRRFHGLKKFMSRDLLWCLLTFNQSFPSRHFENYIFLSFPFRNLNHSMLSVSEWKTAMWNNCPLEMYP